MAVDAAHNVYVPDRGNHRVLKYNDPYGSGSGAGAGVADEVWGQADFNGWRCNRGSVAPTADSLCLWYDSGVDIDSEGNLWIADSGNNRVLRYPNVNGVIQKSADWFWASRTSPPVTGLGNKSNGVPNFRACRQGADEQSGTVYVADNDNKRVLAFDFSGSICSTTANPVIP